MYMALFKSPADREQIANHGHKMFEKTNNVFMDIYRNVTDRKYGYVVIDNTPETAADHQIVANVFDECKRYVILDSSNKLSNEQNKEDTQPQSHATFDEPMISENIVQHNQSNVVEKVEKNYLKKQIYYKNTVHPSIAQLPDDETSNIIWKTNRLDEDDLEAIKNNLVNQIP